MQQYIVMNRFCGQCGHPTEETIPAGDDRPRRVCSACGQIHYDNPLIVCGCIITHQNKVQLVRRAIAPALGQWTLPAGFMEQGETVEEAAVREAWEEARARVISRGLYQVYSLPQLNQVYLLFRGELTGFHVGEAGHESAHVGLFEESEIPWDNLAFKELVAPALRHLFADMRRGDFPLRNSVLNALPLDEP